MLTTEPASVDYVELDAPGGVPALWAIPHGAHNDRVLLWGGGFASGSMYTHRKLYGHLAKAVGARALIPNYRLLPEGQHPAHSTRSSRPTGGCSTRGSNLSTSPSLAIPPAAGSW